MNISEGVSWRELILLVIDTMERFRLRTYFSQNDCSAAFELNSWWRKALLQLAYEHCSRVRQAPFLDDLIEMLRRRRISRAPVPMDCSIDAWCTDWDAVVSSEWGHSLDEKTSVLIRRWSERWCKRSVTDAGLAAAIAVVPLVAGGWWFDLLGVIDVGRGLLISVAPVEADASCWLFWSFCIRTSRASWHCNS